jgi:phosphatidylinositol alpha-1,6-mannosyltransferase
MRLLFVSPCTDEEHYGGVQLTARLALDGLQGNGQLAEVKVLCYGTRCARRQEYPGRACSGSKGGAAVDALKLRDWADRIVFWHVDLLKLLPFLGMDGRAKYLFLHGIECWRPMTSLTARLMDRIDMFLTNSEFTWDRFIGINPRWKNAAHCVTRLGVGMPESSSTSPGQTPAAVMIGRMDAGEGYKGHRELIEAWPRVLDHIPDAELWIVGGGDGAGELNTLASSGAAARHIRFTGVISDEEKQNLLRQSRCMALPSRGEGFGLVYLEAMRLGRPCLASVHDAGREVVCPPRAGFAVEPRDSESLAAALVRLLTAGPEWEGLSASARERYESCFTAAHFQARLRDALLGTAVA